MRILVIEADAITAQALVTALAHEKYVIELIATPTESWPLLEVFSFDLIVLDNGNLAWNELEFCHQLRSQAYQMPVLILTSNSDSHAMACGLDAGADDYLIKPFNPEELEARIRALLRRGNLNASPILCYAGLSLNPSTHIVQYESELLSLTPKEYALLELLLRNPQRVFSCALILEQVWAYDEIPGEDAVRTHIKGLRHKLKQASAPTDLIETVYGIGYRLNPKRLQASPVRGRSLAIAAPPIPPLPLALKPPNADPTPSQLWLIGSCSTTLQALQTLLNPWGLAIIALPDVAQVWPALAQAAPDLLILDAASQLTTAIDLCQNIREADRWSYLPIVVLTADTSPVTVNQLFAVGADDFVSQPIVGPELITRIVNRLERAKLFKRLSDRCPIAQIDPKMVCPYQPDRFFNLSQDLLCTIKLDGTFLRLNPTFEQTLGYYSGDLYRQSFLTFVHPDDYHQTVTVFNQALLGIPITHLENRYRCQDGSYKRLAWHSVPGIEDEIIYAIAQVLTP